MEDINLLGYNLGIDIFDIYIFSIFLVVGYVRVLTLYIYHYKLVFKPEKTFL